MTTELKETPNEINNERITNYQHYPLIANKNSYPHKVLRVVSVNVNGLRSAEKKAFLTGWKIVVLMLCVCKKHG